MDKKQKEVSKNYKETSPKEVAKSSVFVLFLTMFKIGLFTFGGGYAMIAIMEREIIEKKKWIEREDFMDLIGISESTPGPLAVNSATYIGYKIHGFWGSFFSTLGAVLPSFIIIFVISLFFEKFMSLTYVNYAFMGIQACVAFIIVSAGIKMLKNVEKNALNVILFVLTVATYLTFSLLSVSFSSVYYILIGGTIGVLIYLFNSVLLKKKKMTVAEKAEDGESDVAENAYEESLIKDDKQNNINTTTGDINNTAGDVKKERSTVDGLPEERNNSVDTILTKSEENSCEKPSKRGDKNRDTENFEGGNE